MSIMQFGATVMLGKALELFSSNRMTAAGGTPPTGFSRGNFGILTPDTVEGFDVDLVQTPITPGFISINIRTLTDLGQGYWEEIQFRNTGNDPVWFDHVMKSDEAATYAHIIGSSVWSFTGGPSGAPGFFIQGSIYDLEFFR